MTGPISNGKWQRSNGELKKRAGLLRLLAMTPKEFNERLLQYGVRVIKVVEALPRTLTGRRIGDQLLRSGISVGAHYEEAQAAESREDFVHKLQIALKELRESNYWLRLLSLSGAVSPGRLKDILDESNQLRAMLSKAVATTKGKRKALEQKTFDSGVP